MKKLIAAVTILFAAVAFAQDTPAPAEGKKDAVQDKTGQVQTHVEKKAPEQKGEAGKKTVKPATPVPSKEDAAREAGKVEEAQADVKANVVKTVGGKGAEVKPSTGKDVDARIEATTEEATATSATTKSQIHQEAGKVGNAGKAPNPDEMKAAGSTPVLKQGSKSADVQGVKPAAGKKAVKTKKSLQSQKKEAGKPDAGKEEVGKPSIEKQKVEKKNESPTIGTEKK